VRRVKALRIGIRFVRYFPIRHGWTVNATTTVARFHHVFKHSITFSSLKLCDVENALSKSFEMTCRFFVGHELWSIAADRDYRVVHMFVFFTFSSWRAHGGTEGGAVISGCGWGLISSLGRSRTSCVRATYPSVTSAHVRHRLREMIRLNHIVVLRIHRYPSARGNGVLSKQ
jgi:hypothetical protein